MIARLVNQEDMLALEEETWHGIKLDVASFKNVSNHVLYLLLLNFIVLVKSS